MEATLQLKHTYSGREGCTLQPSFHKEKVTELKEKTVNYLSRTFDVSAIFKEFPQEERYLIEMKVLNLSII